MNWVKIASLMMFLGIGLGAFGSHVLKDKISAYQLEIFKTGVFYHLINALGLLAIGWFNTQIHDPKLNMACLLLFSGIILFSGSLYLLSLTQIKWFGMITPLGGIVLLVGWLMIFLVKF